MKVKKNKTAYFSSYWKYGIPGWPLAKCTQHHNIPILGAWREVPGLQWNISYILSCSSSGLGLIMTFLTLESLAVLPLLLFGNKQQRLLSTTADFKNHLQANPRNSTGWLLKIPTPDSYESRKGLVQTAPLPMASQDTLRADPGFFCWLWIVEEIIQTASENSEKNKTRQGQ